ncbi:branched-chain amino acid transporter AzlD [Alloscardovia theropitheci]|uniref:Branched-chain amino acid transporter AzlD n=1 Tax=Alloscardovia theropitheci TaxID=2496842 RepID=A0A4R0QQI0_9BIFI|nr:AzlD domain-containing protein [Alloscardovia theropitheci]TCD54554.1 branched-chain amino acid transporter AzlD [Alloscardovia theropitheci]
MTMTLIQSLIVIAAAALGTMVTRFLPFLAFPESKPIPPFIIYLGKVLPLAVMGMLVVYSLRATPVTSGSHGIPELIALISLVLVHLKWRNMLVSMATGTVLYMVLIQTIFA